ncbi:hypothetical protein I2I11_16980 [Pontibacter sp. 172403-2]|nr:hypothetical protein [Pontibacter sp. 172403-2]MBF9255001.1 hypothetical protein [Pontibacter sp. 172403-2]
MKLCHGFQVIVRMIETFPVITDRFLGSGKRGAGTRMNLALNTIAVDG